MTLTSTDGPVDTELRALEEHFDDKPEGPISAAIIAGGIGCVVLGLLTTLAEANETIKGWLEINVAVGPLSGKTIYTVVAWLIAWAVLHVAMKNTQYETRRAFTISMILIAVGVVGTFPTFFLSFAPE